jgi:hypothetical protein
MQIVFQIYVFLFALNYLTCMVITLRENALVFVQIILLLTLFQEDVLLLVRSAIMLKILQEDALINVLGNSLLII